MAEDSEQPKRGREIKIHPSTSDGVGGESVRDGEGRQSPRHAKPRKGRVAKKKTSKPVAAKPIAGSRGGGVKKGSVPTRGGGRGVKPSETRKGDGPVEGGSGEGRGDPVMRGPGEVVGEAWDDTQSKAPLERRREVQGDEQESFQQNFEERRRHEVASKCEWESDQADRWRGRLSRFWWSSWLFDQRTRKLKSFTLFGLLVLVLALAHSQLLAKRELRLIAEPSVPESPPILPLGEEYLLGREASREAIDRFFDAETVEEVKRLIRHPEVVEPLFDAWLERHPLRPRDDYSFEGVAITELEGSRFFLHEVYFENLIDPRTIAVEVTPRGCLVDWETVVAYQSMDWKTVREERPTEPFFLRVMVEPSEYYNFEFQDASAWSSYRLFHPGEIESLIGYVEAYSPMDRVLELSTSGGADTYILRLQFLEEAESDHALRIVEILQDGWVRPYSEGEEHFDLRP